MILRNTLLNLLPKLCFLGILAILLSGCSFSQKFEDIPISQVNPQQLQKEVTLYKIRFADLHRIVKDKKLSVEEKLNKLATQAHIKDFAPIFWYLNFYGNQLDEEILTLHSLKDIFTFKADKAHPASFECMEGAMLAAKILEKKNIKPYILLLHGLNFQSGHAVCIYRTKEGWATVGVNVGDFIKPHSSLVEFKEKLNMRFREYGNTRLQKGGKIIWFSICQPAEIHDNFVYGEERYLLWDNIVNFFRSNWY